VNEVVAEFMKESEVPGTSLNGSVNGHATLADQAADIAAGASRLGLQPAVADRLSRQLSGMAAGSQGDRLQRLERSLMRLERVNLQTLALLQELVEAIKKAPGSGEE
jgi:hypothetical protein